MGISKLNGKGQLSIEFILILTVIILLIQIVILPLKDNAEKGLNSMSKVSYLEQDLKKVEYYYKVAKNYDNVSLSFELYVPKDANFFITKNKFGYVVSFDENMSKYSLCDNNICIKEIHVKNLDGDLNLGQGHYLIAVKKVDGNVVFVKKD